MRNWRIKIPLLILTAIIVISLLAPLIAPYDPLSAPSGEELRPPSLTHFLGTDLLGRDVFSRVLYGGRWTLSVAALALLLAFIPGLILGMIAGVNGGLIDHTITIVLDALLAFPGLLLAMSLIALLGNGPFQIAVAVGLAAMPGYARIVRSATLSIREQPYVEAARAIGARPLRVLFWHILPNMAVTLIAFATVILSWAILSAAALNFLGFGGDPALPEWGTMLAEGRQAFRAAPWAAIAPGVAIMFTLFVVNVFAAALEQQPHT